MWLDDPFFVWGEKSVLEDAFVKEKWEGGDDEGMGDRISSGVMKIYCSNKPGGWKEDH